MWRYADNLRALYETPAARGPATTVIAARGRRRSSTARAPRAGRCSTRPRRRRCSRATASRSCRRGVARRRGRGGRGRARDRLPGRGQALVATSSRTRPTSAASSSAWRTTPPCARAFDEIQARPSRRRGARALPGRDGAADGRPQRGPRADPGEHRRSAARTGAAVRRGRRAGRGVARPGARAAAADDDPRAAPRSTRRGSRGRCAACRGRPPVDLDALASLLVRFGDLVADQRRIREIDINPLLATPSGVIALDARVVLHNPGARDAELPRPAIRPYPTEYVWTETLARRRAVHDPADPARRRAAAGRVPRDALRGERPAALPASVQARRSGPRTSG